MLLNRSKLAMDAIRASAKELNDMEIGDLVYERNHVRRTMDLTRMGVNTLTVLGLLGYTLFLNHIAKFNAERRKYALALEMQHEQLELDVLRRTEELSELTLHLQTAREDERAHVARELHDELGALLTAAKFDIARLKRSLGNIEPQVEDRIHHLNETINQGIALKRRITEDLRPSALTNLGLIAALEIQAREFQSRSGLTLKLALNMQVVPLSDEAKLTVYRLVQESFTNIAKHANASQVQLSLRLNANSVVVTVTDDGNGFNPAAIAKTSHGLKGMRYRVEAHGGKLHLKSSAGNGTQIEAWLPSKLEASG
jgi:signal transduction histidine kinase